MSLLGIIVAGLAIAGLATVRFINRKMSGLAAVQEKTMGQLEDLANAFDASTTAVGIELDDLKNQLQRASTAGQAPDPSTISRLANISDRLKAMTGRTVTVAGTAQSVGTAPTAGDLADGPNAAMAPLPQPTTSQNVETPAQVVTVPSALSAPTGSSVSNEMKSGLPPAPGSVIAPDAVPTRPSTAPGSLTDLDSPLTTSTRKSGIPTK